ncbi:hypothetical protein ACG9XW_08540 [Acinetobacter guillouiae]|uniref:hypothetical protein n=1 Tax=Acinetobacter guillouiae TaxID=106649 RepID=UPI003AF71847
MAFYVVSYDLHKDRDYSRIHKGIMDLSSNWCKPLASLYVLESTKTSLHVRDFLANYLDSDDSLLVIEVKPPLNWAARNLSSDVVKWLG